MGVLDDDGYLTITDRISDVIIRGGENISAAEIEELLMGMDQVAEVCVVAEPDPRLGEHAAAVVRVRDGGEVPTMDEVRAHLAAGRAHPAEVARGPLRGGRVAADPVGEGAEVRAPPPAREGALARSAPHRSRLIPLITPLITVCDDGFSFSEMNDIVPERARQEELPHGALSEAG